MPFSCGGHRWARRQLTRRRRPRAAPVWMRPSRRRFARCCSLDALAANEIAADERVRCKAAMRQAEAMQRAAAMRQSAADSAGGEAGPGGAGDVKTSSRVPVDLSVPAPPELPRDVRGQPASARLRAVANRAVASVLGVAGGRKVLPGGDADRTGERAEPMRRSRATGGRTQPPRPYERCFCVRAKVKSSCRSHVSGAVNNTQVLFFRQDRFMTVPCDLF